MGVACSKMASSAPSFSEVVSGAKAWLETSPLILERTDESERKIFIRASAESLYIAPPEGASEWTVWSDSDNAAHVISPHLEYLGSRSRSIEEILTKLQTLFLSPKEQKSVTDSEGYLEDGEEVGLSDEEAELSDDLYDQYYGDGGDVDAENEEVKKKEKYEEDGVTADEFFTGDGSPVAVHRLLQDLKTLKKSGGQFGIAGNPRGDNLFIWDIELFDFDKKSRLYVDLINYSQTYNRKLVIELEMKFPKDYPMNPPFVRVIRPRFQFLTGHVTIGGSVCMEMLTRSGWSPSNDIESILIQVRSEIMSDPKVRLDGNPNREYSESEAKSAFDRMVMKYGWNR